MAREIVLIYDAECPNVEAARRNLREAIAANGRRGRWKEIDRGDPTAPGEYRRFGSPTILIEGQDAVGSEPGSNGDCCRLYASADGRLLGVPSVEQISAALVASSQRTSNSWGSTVLSLPALGVVLLPSVTCPACWPAYAAFLGAIGVGFVPTDGLLLPVTIVALLLLLVAFAWRAVRTRPVGPLALAGAAAAMLVIGRFVWPAPFLHYAGLTALVAASGWNIRLKPRKVTQANCPNCLPVVSLE